MISKLNKKSLFLKTEVVNLSTQIEKNYTSTGKNHVDAQFSYMTTNTNVPDVEKRIMELRSVISHRQFRFAMSYKPEV